MNLCGGMVNTSETEFLIPSVLTSGSSEEDVSLTLASATRKIATPRRRKKDGMSSPEYSSVRTPSSRNKNKHASSVPGVTPSPPLLNPLSKEDLKKSRSRQRPLYSPLKSYSANMKKLESGFRLVWHTSGESENKNVTMELSPDRSHLRLLEIEPEGGAVIDSLATDIKSIDMKLRVENIKRIESAKTKSNITENSQSAPPDVVESIKYFTIIMSKAENDVSSFGFETESPGDREAIISGLKLLLDQAKASSLLKIPKGGAHEDLEERTSEQSPGRPGTLSPLQRTRIHSQPSASQSQEGNGDVSRKSGRHAGEGTETSLAYFDFNMAKRGIETVTETLHRNITMPNLSSKTRPSKIPITPRRQPNLLPSDLILDSALQNTREKIIRNSSDDDARDNSVVAAEGNDLRDKNTSSSDGESCEAQRRGSSSARRKDSSDGDEVRELSVRILESDSLRDESVEVTGSEWSESDEWIPNAGKGSANNTSRAKATAAPQTGVAIISHRTDALKHVEDIELMAIANKMADPWCADDICTSALAGQMAEPWCTDDVCTAALKDVTDACKGIFDLKQQAEAGKKSQKEGQREIVEDYIAGVLGAPSAMAASMLSVGDVWNTSATVRPESESWGPEVDRIQNRASVNNAQARRLQRLRSEMTFEAAHRHSRSKLQYVQTVTSVDDIEVSRRREKRRSSLKPRPTSGLADPFDSSALLQQVVGNMVRQEPAKDDEEILYYDSDPESARLRTHRLGPRRVHAERLNEIDDPVKRRRRTLSGIPVNRLVGGRRWKKMDESLVAEVIEAMKNEKLTLIWHPTQTKQFPNRAPLCVKVWIESGVYLIDGTFLLPKLTWIPQHERHLDSKLLNVAKECPERLDLLDVCRVRESETVDRRLHPFARADRSFVIQTQSEIFLFEAPSKEERSRIVNGLKLVIARLASLLMLRDLRAVDEFFGGGSVPGEAPAWASGNPNNPEEKSDMNGL